MNDYAAILSAIALLGAPGSNFEYFGATLKARLMDNSG